MRRVARLPARLLPLALAGLLICLLGRTQLQAQAGNPDEYAVKAAFLFQFTNFIEWPQHVNGDSIVVCVLGKDPFGRHLEEIRGRNTLGLFVEARRIHSLGEAAACRLLFLSDAYRGKSDEILQAAERWGVVTVSEGRGFAERGGVISFVMREGRIRFAINPDAARRSGIKISSKLLRLAEIVGPENK